MSREIDPGESPQQSFNLRSRILDHFSSSDVKLVNPASEINRIQRMPLFIVAGIQILDGVIYKGAGIPSQRLLVFQPVVRPKFTGRVNFEEPSTTSFVNLSSLRVNAGYQEHIASLQEWLNLLKENGVDDVSIFERETNSDWGEGIFKNRIMDIFSKGVHVGDAVYREDVPQAERENIEISDISFGYERLLKANGSKEQTFLDIDVSDEQHDLIRTLTLIMGGGVFPSGRVNRERVVRKMVRKLSTNIDIYQCVYGYHKWWSQFSDLPISPSRIIEAIQIEKSSQKGF